MFGFQTVSCIHDIPMVRSSATQLQNAYKKAKNTSVIIRFPCYLAETIVGKTIQVGITVASPFVKHFSGPVHAIDEYTAKKIRQIESKYPIINTSMDNVMNSVRDTTTSKIQHGKKTVANVAANTVNKASCAAGSLYSLYETRAPKFQQHYTGDALGLVWLRMLLVNILLKTKQVNDFILHKVSRRYGSTILPQQLLIRISSMLEFCIRKIRPVMGSYDELRSDHRRPQVPTFINKQTLKSNPHAASDISRNYNHENFSDLRSKYPNMTNIEESNDALASKDLDETDYNPMFTQENHDRQSNDDIELLHDRLKPTDVELLYSQLPADVLLGINGQQPLTDEQQLLHARVTREELEHSRLSDVNDDERDQE